MSSRTRVRIFKRHKFTQDYPSERTDYPRAVPSDRQVPPSAPETEPSGYHPVQGDPDDGGKISPADAERISSEDLPGPEMPETEEEERKKAA